ncbi:hypothetical protein [Lactobacillus kefiranofaciens]|uniref:Uncharacterized protein n=1 Tax=Lactobacillus kefiranofaciens TaxID=267818 RepID=A0AAX3UG69_9LACO|nr:hypothetical protein [Lactobacillus kefiranofaciens]KRM20327.1 hypothetical protein FC93_GL001674 [Lactobacillus kefiranofaciens subsp. kefiranofaciens DSM 5016 = JCM 6985]AEG40016.1 hypothetical protein WANG_0321 [Lactobacillus kefiranofaciens subsp. kefiranofaciens]MCJ2172886.1 hypothetical protein [Lactobacillus kefiranofaciens]MCP9331515.1 hypothetical protein [Lactobacillus kefiranofaciens]PAK97607.1 hypothetical protein B8W86_09110 [Lactobacillus kefiranofaciens]
MTVSATSLRDKIVATKQLKEMFKDNGGITKLREYDREICNFNQNILILQQKLETNSRAFPDRQQKKLQKKLEKEYLKQVAKRDDLVRARGQLAILIDDFKKNQGKIPSPKIQQHLRDYLNNRKRF